VRYRACVSIGFVGGGGAYPGAARESLAAAIAAHLAIGGPGVVTELDVGVRSGTTVVVDAVLRGTAPHEWTSPLDALARLDAAVLRALAVTGQFEEFDVARRTVGAQPVD
jgi:hypothetical protein